MVMASRVLRALTIQRHRPLSLLYISSVAPALYSCPKPSAMSSPSPPLANYHTLQPKPGRPPVNTRFLSASSGSSKILIVNSDTEFSNVLSKAQENNGLAIAYFTAVWCGPCRAIAPLVENLSTNHSGVTFLKLDIDQESLSNTLRNSGVTSVPTFHFYKNGAKVADLVGADPDRLKEIVGNLSD
uniref:Thioredoxin domain-containing protein n=1 Tax=Araucaria cunninghamii TaxID=56994 RepID=A0A0D6R5V8_ARACU